MRSSEELAASFFYDLKHFNNVNFKTLAHADILAQDATTHKAFSSVITRYFIFREKHPEYTDPELNMLYYKLKLDLVAQYFSKYPDVSPDHLVAFQIELNNYIEQTKGDTEDERIAI